MDSLILIGPPGAGKGTQAKFLVSNYALVHISTGDLVRKEIASNSEMGQRIKTTVSQGFLPEDDIIYSLLIKEIRGVSLQKGIIFDGFPRRIAQAQYLDEIFSSLNRSLGYVISLHLCREVLIKRITGRLSCQECGASYNIYYKKPVHEGACDICGSSKMYKRSDDTLESLDNRLSEYESQISPLFDYYKEKGIFYSIDADKKEEEVSSELKKILG